MSLEPFVLPADARRALHAILNRKLGDVSEPAVAAFVDDVNSILTAGRRSLDDVSHSDAHRFAEQFAVKARELRGVIRRFDGYPDLQVLFWTNLSQVHPDQYPYHEVTDRAESGWLGEFEAELGRLIDGADEMAENVKPGRRGARRDYGREWLIVDIAFQYRQHFRTDPTATESGAFYEALHILCTAAQIEPPSRKLIQQALSSDFYKTITSC